MNQNKQSEFEKAGEEKQSSLFSEFIELLKHNKKYWLIPLLLVLLGLGLVVVLGGTAAAPFIYTLF